MGNQEATIISELEGRVTANSNRILSLSGGGIKGISELVVLSEIEELTGKSISELFPIITGTSVGGLIAGLLTIPKELGSSEPKYSAKEALEIFKAAAPKIFENHWYSGVKQIFKHKYSQRGLKEVLEEYVGNNRLSGATSRLMIPVTNLNTDGREVEVFDSHDLFGESGHSDPKMKNLLLATTAAPTYFKSVSNVKYVKGYSNKEEVLYAYADGGLGANRPAYEAFKKIRKEQNSKKGGAIIVSLNLNNEIAATRAIPRGRNDGIVGWLTKGKLVDRLLKSSEDAAVESIHNILGDKDKHYEMVLPIGKDTQSLDDASKKNIAALEELGNQYIKEHDQQLQKLCDNLLHNL
ncbi:hypothetical protein A3306_07430 (plasmid) [Rickettsia bellii]|nr:patatin-like phospholipase family protein [Rickettsia bellii]ARD87014.1 hypothetical protein A3306_07430 [Rickettsia bellii]